jgi:hypothetical protein
LPQQLAALDAQLARRFADKRSLAATEDYAPLPILGVPGWAPENESERYYDDTQQFRPGRTRERGPAAAGAAAESKQSSGQRRKRK